MSLLTRTVLVILVTWGGAMSQTADGKPSPFPRKPPLAPQPAVYHRDFDAAMKAAGEQGKDLCVIFSAPEWNPFARLLDEKVIYKEEFWKPMAELFVLARAEFPDEGEPIPTDPIGKRWQEVKLAYRVTQYPMAYMISRKGDLLGMTAFKDTDCKGYMAYLTKSYAKGKAAVDLGHELRSIVAQAKGKQLVSIIERAAEGLLPLISTDPGVGPLVEIAKIGLILDPDNETGLKFKVVKGLMLTTSYNAEYDAFLSAADPKNERGAFERALFGRVGKKRAPGTKTLAEEIAEFDKLKPTIIVDNLYFRIYALAANGYKKPPLSDLKKAKYFAEKALLRPDVEPWQIRSMKELLLLETLPPADGSKPATPAPAPAKDAPTPPTPAPGGATPPAKAEPMPPAPKPPAGSPPPGD